MSLRGSVERQAQHELDRLKEGRPDWLKKSIIESAEVNRLNKPRVGLTEMSKKPLGSFIRSHCNRNILGASVRNVRCSYVRIKS